MSTNRETGETPDKERAMETGATRGDNACGDGAAMLARLGGATGGDRDGGEDERAGIVSSKRDIVDNMR